ncbi:hypothetical protein PC129_g19570 [Phytophthora cactorum]|uniref:Uncharacterized protein n=1 Tax=Phytophthora cactorum TaxID=29920 RepID=A0A329S843_9STRA|nr:hypothetical protein Pcac1_g26832 [Phytophthora cactorum]KAG2801501.1 hypothetical protein PC112_g20015 [Phytophthora cactorum]KAG2810940.1 hypothetical protein PC111_g15442 [Phytophthora cactorum]KAG2836988.1 hypothetical protein PC113_g19923 [Phytophthora cactorum]KAG2879214.1 hypothetical protein PC114_g22682 [Phytophthora cactorum]
MASLPGQQGDLRDPTLEELYTGPVRALPDEIQQLPAEDTACTFCGVSYFVFAEVQALQTTVKQYKKTFRDFVRFMEQERSVARDLRQQVTELKGSFADLVAACSSSIKQILEQSEAQRTAQQEALNQLQRLRKELLDSEDSRRELQIFSKRNEEEQKLAHSLVEQKLRNEILHLSSQVENCKLLSESQQAAFKEENDRDQQRIRELESKFVKSQEQWTAAERQLVTERDVLKQQLLAMNERVELESSTAQQLEGQLTAIREELGRVVAASDTERKSSSQMNSEIIQLKHQLQSLDKTRAQLLSENGRYKDDKYKLEDEINALRLRADQLQGQLSVSSASTEKRKSEYTRDLEKLRGEHGNEISRLQRDHARAIEELKASQNKYLEYLKKETAELQARGEESSRHVLLAMEDRLRDAERRANEWKDRALQNASEREEAKRSSSHFESMIQTLQRRLDSSERDKQKMTDKAKIERTELEQRLKSAQNEVRQETNMSLQEAKQRQKELQHENTALRQQVDSLQNQLETLQEKSAKPAKPQAAWETNQIDRRKLSRHESSNQDCEKTINQLRSKLKQKDREISLLQQTVHRECMERTSLLERMRSSKVLPEIAIPSLAAPSDSRASNSCNDTDDCTERLEHSANENQQPKASFYEKLRRAGSRKAKPRK